MISFDDVIRERIQDVGLDSFPDDTAVAWRVLAIEHKGGYAFVEAEAAPATVGYPKFRFVLKPGTMKDVEVLGCYCFDRGNWSLLFTDPRFPDDWSKLP